jgi:hypothetical protein
MKLLTGKVDFAKRNVYQLGPYCVYHYFHKDTTYVFLYRDVVSTDYRILVVIVRFRENRHRMYWGSFEEPRQFWSRNIIFIGYGLMNDDLLDACYK